MAGPTSSSASRRSQSLKACEGRKNDQERAAFHQGFLGARAMLAKWQRDLITGVSAARSVELPGANLYMFLSNEADILREVRNFADSLNQ